MAKYQVHHGHGDVGCIQTIRADKFDISHEGNLHFVRHEMENGEKVEIRVAVFSTNHWSAVILIDDDQPQPTRLTLVPEDAPTNDVA